jgi:acetyl esterase
MEYARKLEANGVRVISVHMSDQMHGFLTMGRVVRAADLALDMAGAALVKAFAAEVVEVKQLAIA